MKKILITFVGNHDPFSDNKQNLGPILSILKQQKFDIVYLLFNAEKYWKSLIQTQKYCNEKYPQMKVEYRFAESINPIDYNLVYPAMYKVIKKIVADNRDSKFTISLTSGTPTMHTCWVLLKQGAVIDAELLQISKENGISKVNFRLDDFPKIKATEDVKIEMTKLARENEFMRKRLDSTKSLENGFYIPDEGIALETSIIPAYYKGALAKCNGNATEAAKLLGLKPHTFRKRLRRINGRK